MLCVDVSFANPFIPLPYEQALTPRLKRVQETLCSGNGAGGAFTDWVDWPVNYDREEYARIKAAAARIQQDSQALVVIGIGGSYLGAKGMIDFLCSPNYNLKSKNTPNIYFTGNTLNGAALQEILDLVKDVDFSVNVISKSGTTTEPAVAFRFFRQLLIQKYGKEGAAKRIYATTDREKGALHTLALAEGYETFVVPDGIGGRYSVLTPVGLLPAAVVGIDTDALLEGAASMRERCLTQTYEENPSWQYVACRYELYRRGKHIEILGCYDPAFRFMTEWWKQLYGESEGKEGKGIFPASVEFTADLHSMGQYIQQGERHLMETIVRFADTGNTPCIPADEQSGDGLDFLTGQSMEYLNQQAMDGTLLAHVEGGVPNLLLQFDAPCAFTLGELIYFFAFSCGLSGYLGGVNPFDQPGVEDYKVNMFSLLGKPGYEENGAVLREKLGRI